MTTGIGTTTAQLVDTHRPTLDRALEAIAGREFWTPHPEHPKAYGEGAAEQGKAAFDALCGSRFELPGQPVSGEWVATEVSPYGPELGISYPRMDEGAVDALLPVMRGALPAWRKAGAEVRAAVCLEILARISARTPEFAQAVMHTSGQAFMMAFQAGGPHAQDRGMEAVAYAYAEQVRTPARVSWEKPQGKRDPLRVTKEFTPRPGAVSRC